MSNFKGKHIPSECVHSVGLYRVVHCTAHKTCNADIRLLLSFMHSIHFQTTEVNCVCSCDNLISSGKCPGYFRDLKLSVLETVVSYVSVRSSMTLTRSNRQCVPVILERCSNISSQSAAVLR